MAGRADHPVWRRLSYNSVEFLPRHIPQLALSMASPPSTLTPDDSGTVDDDVLMRAFAAGDAGAFVAPLCLHNRRCTASSAACSAATSRRQTDEVFQDTWLKVVNARDTWSPQGATFRTWLFTLAHHRAIDLLRRSGREVALDAYDGDDGEPWQPDGTAWQHWPAPASSAPQAEDLAFWKRAGEKLLVCLEQLPIAQRSAFLLHHDDGLALDEVARALEVGFETAKTRLRYAMSKLRTCMGAYLEPLRHGGST